MGQAKRRKDAGEGPRLVDDPASRAARDARGKPISDPLLAEAALPALMAHLRAQAHMRAQSRKYRGVQDSPR